MRCCALNNALCGASPPRPAYPLSAGQRLRRLSPMTADTSPLRVPDPMLATLGAPPAGPGWAVEFKWDGFAAGFGRLAPR
jgi:ATP-dependent DNA ligase